MRVFRAHLQGHFPPARPLQTLQRKSQAVQGQVLCQSKRRRGLGSNSRQAERTSQRRQMHHNTQGNLVWLLLRPFDITIRKQVVTYHWRALSQVSFLLRQRVFSRQKTCFVAKKSMLVATKFCLSRQKVCHGKYVATEHVFRFLCRDRTRLLSRQNYASTVFIATKVCLSRQNYVCRDKLLSRQKTCFVVTNTFCRDKHKTFVASKMILMAAPANDSKRAGQGGSCAVCDKQTKDNFG